MRSLLLGLGIGLGLGLGLGLGIAAPKPAAAEIMSYALVQPDATLKVRGRIIRLHGIHIPDTGRTCRTNIRPARCGSRAALALDFKIRRFVRCVEVTRNPDRSIDAVCRVAGEDLGAWLLTEGWALALPGAPFEYLARERIARAHHRGVWGFQADGLR